MITIELTENITLLLDEEFTIIGSTIFNKSSVELTNWIYNNVENVELEVLASLKWTVDEGTRQLGKEITETILEAVEAENLMK